MESNIGDDSVKIPLSFDGQAGRTERTSTLSWVVVTSVIFFFIWLITVVLAPLVIGIIMTIIYGLIFMYILRYLIFRELFYRKKLQEIKENEYLMEHSSFWNIHDISEGDIPIYYMKDKKAIFMTLDKDVIIGKNPEENMYNHYEEIADALREIDNKKVKVMHVDYMATLGNDKRMTHLFDSLENVKNPDIKKLLLAKYSYMEETMLNSYASYDVIVFYSTLSNDIFVEEVLKVVSLMKRANYIRYKPLTKSECAKLAMDLFNLEVFSVNSAIDSVYKKASLNINAIKLIWTEKDGVVTKVNDTKEERNRKNRVTKAERDAKKALRKEMKRKQKLEKERLKKGIKQEPEKDEEDIFKM